VPPPCPSPAGGGGEWRELGLRPKAKAVHPPLASAALPRWPGDRHVGEDLVLLHARLGRVGGVDELQRAFAQERARQDHHADEAARPIGGLREYGLGPALVPRAAWAVGGRAAVSVDADAALDQAADARPLMAVGMGAAAGWKRDAVAAQEELARGQGGERRGQLLARGHAGRSASGRRSKVEAPAGRARRGGVNRRRAFAVPGLAVAQRAPRDRRAAVHEEDHARGRRQRERRAVRQHIFVKREHGRHGVAFLVGWATALPLPTRRVVAVRTTIWRYGGMRLSRFAFGASLSFLRVGNGEAAVAHPTCSVRFVFQGLGARPPPLAGEGWGGGELARVLLHAPSLSLPRKRGRGRCGASDGFIIPTAWTVIRQR